MTEVLSQVRSTEAQTVFDVIWLSYRQLSYDEATGMVRCRSKRGGHREWHATEFLAVLAQHVPRPRQHVVTYAGHYANAAGNLNHEIEDSDSDGETKDTKGGSRRYSWAELLALVWRVDPLECPKVASRWSAAGQYAAKSCETS